MVDTESYLSSGKCFVCVEWKDDSKGDPGGGVGETRESVCVGGVPSMGPET